MHRGRTWTQRQLIGLGTPEDYNKRVRRIIDAGATAISLLPCNSGFRGIDCDEVDPVLLGTCGTVINTTDHMDRALDGVPARRDLDRDERPVALHAARLHARRGRAARHPIGRSVTGTSNQSDYISHFIANHMFYRLSLPGARRVLLDHIAFCRTPCAALESDVGRRPAHAAGRRDAGRDDGLHALDRDAVRRGLHRPRHGPRRRAAALHVLLRHLDQLLRGGRQVPRRPPHLGAAGARAARRQGPALAGASSSTARPRASTSREQQPLNNIARVAVQAMAGIMGGLQSLHTDAYDEAIACPSEETARIAVATQNILREEAHLSDVIDPLGGSYYVETLTDQMEAKILA